MTSGSPVLHPVVFVLHCDVPSFFYFCNSMNFQSRVLFVSGVRLPAVGLPMRFNRVLLSVLRRFFCILHWYTNMSAQHYENRLPLLPVRQSCQLCTLVQHIKTSVLLSCPGGVEIYLLRVLRLIPRASSWVGGIVVVSDSGTHTVSLYCAGTAVLIDQNGILSYFQYLERSHSTSHWFNM